MELDLIKSQSQFGFIFEGENEIEASLLSNIIRDIAELTELAAKEKDAGASLKLSVTAFNNGSFQIDFTALCLVASSLISALSNDNMLARFVVEIIKGFFEIKKFLKGEKPNKITDKNNGETEIENNEGQVINVNKSSVAAINNVRIDHLVVNFAQTVQEHNSSGGFRFLSKTGDCVYSADDVRNLNKPSPIVQEITCKKQEVIVDLPIKKPDLTGRSTWDLKYNGHVIAARINDEAWIEKVNSGSISIRAGDYIRATLEIIVEIDSQGNPIPNTEKYFIIKIFDIYHNNSEQMIL